MSRLLTALAVATASATLILTAPTAPAVAVAHPVTTTAPAAAAAGWLSQQLIDGTHLVFSFDGKTFDGGGTADLSFALAAAKSGADDINTAVSYLATHVAGYTMISDKSGKPGPADGAIGKSAVAAMVAGDDPTSFGGYNLLQTLKADECTVVSGDPNDFTVPVCPAVGAGRNTFSSIAESFTVLAEARGAAIDASYAPSPAAVGYLLSLQCPDGGFTTSTTGGTSCSSDVDATGYAMMALEALGGHGTEIGKAADWLESTRASNGAWVSNGGPNVDSTGLAASALDAAGRRTTTSRRWLVDQQVTTGPTLGKGASRGALKYLGAFNPDLSVKGTSDGVLGMVPGAGLATLTAHGAVAHTSVLALDEPSVAHPSLESGATQSVTGRGFSAGEKVVGVLHSTTVAVGIATANAKGTVTLRFRVPSTLTAGTHTVTLTGARSGLSSSVVFTVAVAPTPTTTTTAPALAATGRDGRQTDLDVWLGAALVAAGGAALLLGRRRPSRR